VPDPLGFLFLSSREFYVFHRGGRRSARFSAVCALILACALIPASAVQSSGSEGTAKAKKTSTVRTTHKRHNATVRSSKSSGTMHNAASKKSLRRKKSSRVRGQQKIDSERAQSIQAALIREHYLTGEATGTWNTASEEAMRKYQADHGWQSKTVPDSRALIKLGLGPSKDHLLNPESAMTTIPDPPKATSIPPTSNTAAPVANSATPAPTTSPASVGSSGPQ
jgi:peptidoglycan hydrolase-like protein with peptidoglycan-binding domain